MAHLIDVFNAAGTVRFGPLSGHGLVAVPPPPGDSDTGSIVGSIIDVVGGIIGGRAPGLPQLPPAPGGTPPLLQGPGTGRSGPGFTLGGAIPPTNGCLPNPCCSGQHLNKTMGCDGAPPGTKCVSNRRMDPLNPKALRRAIRRAKGFERFVKSNRKALRGLAKI